MRLLSDDTLWIFLLASSKEAEVRHVYDIAFGVTCLYQKSISPDNIKLIIDGDIFTINEHLKIFPGFPKVSFDIFPSKELKRIIQNSSNKNIVVFVTGHGNFEKGIDAPNPIKPYSLLDSVKCNKNTQNIVIYLGQCYAGIFNYIDVKGTPTIVIIGATNLYPSISYQFPNITWQANLFLLNLFKWIKSPNDIDGDGKITVMDSFKYAGAETNRYCQSYKSTCLSRTIEILEELRGLNKIKDELKWQALQEELCSMQNIHYNNQEPWILNAIPAQLIEF